MEEYNRKDTICALSTGIGMGAIAIIRTSGIKAFSICNKIFSKNITNVKSHSIHFGILKKEEEIIDEVLISFRCYFLRPEEIKFPIRLGLGSVR